MEINETPELPPEPVPEPEPAPPRRQRTSRAQRSTGKRMASPAPDPMRREAVEYVLPVQQPGVTEEVYTLHQQVDGLTRYAVKQRTKNLYLKGQSNEMAAKYNALVAEHAQLKSINRIITGQQGIRI